MKEWKKLLSMVSVLALLFGAAWAVGSLLDILLGLSQPICICMVLSVEMLAMRLRCQHGLTVKSVVGMVFLIILTIALGIGLLTSSQYLIAWITGDSLGTSFPWYTGFAFAFLILGPVLLVTGIIWMVLHLRERKGNVRDIRLLMQLIFAGTAFWAILWTILRIVHVLVFLDSFGHPWYAAFGYGLMFFTPWLLLEGGVLWLLRHFEKKLTAEDWNEAKKEHRTACVPMEIHWPTVFGDGAVVMLPLMVVAAFMGLSWDTGYLLQNIVLVICSTMTVCLTIGIAAWMIHQYFGAGGVRDFRVVTVILMILTVAAAGIWFGWYSGSRLGASSGLPGHLVYTLALGFIGPVLLGEGMMLVLLCRFLKRTGHDGAPVNRNTLWILALAGILVLESGMLWGQFTEMEYKDELDVTVQKVSYPDSDREHHFMVTVSADYDVRWIRDTLEETRDDGMYLKCTTTWNPIREIGDRRVEWNLYPDRHIQNLYVYRPGVGYELILVKDGDTGNWEFCE